MFNAIILVVEYSFITIGQQTTFVVCMWKKTHTQKLRSDVYAI